MTTEKIREAFAACRALLEPHWKAERNGPRGPHLVFMCEEGASYAEHRREKAMRWLGFVQGALWALDKAPIEELKNMNRPDELERSRFVKEIHDASQRVDEFPDWMKTMRDRSVEASEYAKGVVVEPITLSKPPRAPLEVLSDPPQFRPATVLKFTGAHTDDERRQVMAILERLAAAEKEIERLRAALQGIVDDKNTNPTAWEIAKGALLL